jgi:hypothetical protein
MHGKKIKILLINSLNKKKKTKLKKRKKLEHWLKNNKKTNKIKILKMPPNYYNNYIRKKQKIKKNLMPQTRKPTN